MRSRSAIAVRRELGKHFDELSPQKWDGFRSAARGEYEVLKAGCASGAGVEQFDSVYRRYSFESGRWVRRERRAKGRVNGSPSRRGR